MRLSILIFCCLHGTYWTANASCVYQPKTLYVKEGESVTIPCSYTYDEYWRGRSKITVTWWEAVGINCNNTKKYIIDRYGNIADEYKNRISAVHHPDNQTASITIRGLKAADGITVCCRVIRLTAVYGLLYWYDTYGTSLTFADGRWVTQMEELIAVPGEEMVIPCHYPLEILGEALQVTWYTGDSAECSFNASGIYTLNITQTSEAYGVSQVNFTEVSLRIPSAQRSELHFCCRVTTSSGQIKQSRSSTEVIITDITSSSSFKVAQPDNVSGHRGESVILNCSYSQYEKNDLLQVNVYWRLGNITGPYVYHPYEEMVHPSYRGRSVITGAADLHIWGLQMSDDSTYYCFVMLKVCKRSKEYKKQIQYGAGTRLIVTDLVQTPTVFFAIYFGLKCFITLLLFVLALLCYKKNLGYKTWTRRT